MVAYPRDRLPAAGEVTKTVGHGVAPFLQALCCLAPASLSEVQKPGNITLCDVPLTVQCLRVSANILY